VWIYRNSGILFYIGVEVEVEKPTIRKTFWRSPKSMDFLSPPPVAFINKRNLLLATIPNKNDEQGPLFNHKIVLDIQ